MDRIIDWGLTTFIAVGMAGLVIYFTFCVAIPIVSWG